MSDRKALVTRALAEKQILKDLHAAHDRTRAELAEHFADPGEREVGMLLDQRLGTVEKRAGRAYWAVVDAAAFEMWVASKFPREFVDVPTVRPSFRDAVLAKCKTDGAFYIDEDSGEAFIPPGVERRTAEPTIVELTDAHAGSVVRHWLGGETVAQLGIEANYG